MGAGGRHHVPAALLSASNKGTNLKLSRGSSVGIATHYVLDGPGIESRCRARFFAPVQTGSEAQPASYTMGTESRGVALTTHPHLAPRLKKE